MTTTRRRHEEEAGAGVVGAGAGQGAYQEAGYSIKHHVDRVTRKGNPGVTPEQIKLQNKTLAPLKSKYGMHLPKGSPGRNNVGYHRAYPLELPHARTIRTLAHTHEGKLGIAIGAGATLAGATGAAALVHHATTPKKKAGMGDIDKRFFSARSRRKAADQGDALPDGSFPIKNKGDLKNAKRLIGHSKHPEAARALIARREEALCKSAFGVDHIAKYVPGTITYHFEQERMHARKKASAQRGIAYGIGTAGVGLGAHGQSEAIGRAIAHSGAYPGMNAAKIAGHVRAGSKVAIAGGAALAGGSLLRRVHHGRRENVEAKKAQEARMARQASLAKNVFGVEAELEKADAPAKKRASTAQGAWTGGAVAGATNLGTQYANAKWRSAAYRRGASDSKAMRASREFGSVRRIGSVGRHTLVYNPYSAGILAAGVGTGAAIAHHRGKSVAKRADTQSAFGVEHEIEKGIAGVLDEGINALKGVKSGLSGAPTVASSAAGVKGVAAGSALKSAANTTVGKLKPLGSFVKTNPTQSALIGGGGAAAGIGVGRATKNNS
jgi:hypothetical protein